jgi:hypothetical protein
MATDKLFTVAGITTHSTAPATVTKVRFGTDLVRVVKMLNNPKKVEDRTLGICLAPVRVDFIELPQPMTKLDAVRFLATHPEFQSPADQALIADTLSDREPKPARQPRAAKVVKVKAAKKSAPSLDAIKARGRKASTTVADVLAAVAPVAADASVTEASDTAAPEVAE